MNVERLWEELEIPPEKHARAVLRLLCEVGISLLRGEESSLLLYDRRNRELVFVLTVGSTKEELVGAKVPLGKGVSGMAAISGEVQIGVRCADELFDLAEDGDPSAVLAAPLLLDDELLGVMTVVSFDRNRHFSLEEGRLAGKLAAAAAVIVSQQRRLRDLNSALRLAGPDDGGTAREDLYQAVNRLADRFPDRVPEIAVLLTALGNVLCNE